jgi:SAM-dependent methyltransferase
MIRRTEQKKRERNSSLSIRPMDMRAIDFPPETFDAVICLFDSIGYVRTNQALIETVNGVHSVLRQKGLFLFEFWHAGAMLRNFEPLRIRRWTTPNGIVERLSETSVDYATSLVTVKYSVYQHRADGSLEKYQEEHVNRCFSIPEMDNYLQQSELTPLRWYAGFKENGNIDVDTWHIVMLVQKQSRLDLQSESPVRQLGGRPK